MKYKISCLLDFTEERIYEISADSLEDAIAEIEMNCGDYSYEVGEYFEDKGDPYDFKQVIDDEDE